MSTPVVTDKWAGNFDCSICRRKRLVGSEFSKKALEKYRKSGHPLKCKTCVTEQERKERALAASKREAAASISNKSKANSDGDEKSDGVPVTCASCKQKLLPSFYNRNQLSKGEGKARCRSCVEEAIANEAKHSKESKDQKIAKAKEKVRLAKNATEKVKAEAELSALEAEIVTGLKPVVLGRGKSGRGYSRGRGQGRGRGGRNR